ncbi:MAG: mandelate racemase/muconate lactonizing enzyme family protein [Gaiellaceae bacterium]|jgi:L-alanine-DL-glutamate epimerase-like enolase superfamily enzyme
MKITNTEVCLFSLEMADPFSDAIQKVATVDIILVDVTTDAGLTGSGFCYTIGTGGTAILNLLRTDLLPLLTGEDAQQIEALWQKLFWATHATAVGAITSLALSAVDIALWDLRGKATGQPLWLLAGGAKPRVALYDTTGGWLNYSVDQLVAGAKDSVAQNWPGVKIKVGKPDLEEDIERLAAVRQTVGARVHIMVDANQSMTCAEAKRRARRFEDFDLFWFEEPLPADDICGHVRLTASTSIPIAVGESIYSPSYFREYLAAGAASIVQPDVARIGGITPWLKTAHLAETFNVKVAPHAFMEIHVSLAAAVPNSLYVEYIGQSLLKDVTTAPIQVVDGHAAPPSTPGVGIEWDREAIQNLQRRI